MSELHTAAEEPEPIDEAEPEDEPEPNGALTREWRRWVAVSLMDGMSLPDVLAVLADEGLPRAESVRYCARLYDDPAFEAGLWTGEQLRKLQSVLAMRERMRALSPLPIEVDRRSRLTQQEFLHDYYAQNTPVIMDDVCDRWPALRLWSPAYLLDKLGAVEVEVMTDRNSDPNYEVNSNEHKFVMPFDEYVAKIEATDRSNDLYLVANNKLLAQPAATALWDDFELDTRFLKPDPSHSQAFLWFGPAGTITPLHHDSVNVLFNQVAGRKHFILVPSLEIHRMYNNIAVYSQVDPLSPDLDSHPRFAGAHQYHFDVGPGESLFIPAGWWHHVEGIEAGISVSFTNFAFDNDIDWSQPTLSF